MLTAIVGHSDTTQGNNYFMTRESSTQESDATQRNNCIMTRESSTQESDYLKRVEREI